jgi:preprotein translocase subunit YajC
MSSVGLVNLLIIALPLLLIVFLVMSQRRRQRDVQQFQSELDVGDDVVTTSGLFGTVTGLDDTVVHLEVAPGMTLRFDRRAIGMRAPSTPTPGTDAGE